MDNEQFSIIISKLDSILKLLSINAVLGKNLREQVSILISAGFQRKEIADMLGKKPNHIGVVTHELKNKVNDDERQR